MLNKRGQGIEGQETIYDIIRLVIITVLMVLFAFVIAWSWSSKTSTVKGLEADIFVQRFIYSTDCFTYKDYETGRVYGGVIDAKRFTDENLRKCYNATNATTSDVPAFRLSIYQGTIILNGMNITTVNWDDDFKPETTAILPIVFLINDERMRGEMHIEVQNYR